MVISRTPFRMSFFGGGTDNPIFFNKYGGSVISSTFDKYCYVTLRHLPPYFDFKTHLTYSKMEYVNEVSEVEHPAIRNTMKFMNLSDIRLTYDADLPARSGLGTSSSFVVGMLNGFNALKGKYADKDYLSKSSIYIERVLCNESGGWQDQIAAAYGGFNRIDFYNDTYEVRPIIISNERKLKFQKNLMLFYTGVSRFSYEILNDRIKNAEKNEYLKLLNKLTDEAETIFEDENSDLDEIGNLLGCEWDLKKKTGERISNVSIDEIYDKAVTAGALGGKILGAGGGGFMLFYVPYEKQECVKSILADLTLVSFKFENNGSQVIYYSPEDVIS